MGAKSSVSAWSRVSRFTEFETGEGTEGPASPRRRRGGEWPECGLIVRAKNSGAVGRAIASKEAQTLPGNLFDSTTGIYVAAGLCRPGGVRRRA